VQIPTTLLAQVDASVGGKVAVNYEHLKNMIGTFYHPKMVLIDVDTLDSLPPREFNCGMAEVVKYGLIEKSVPGFTGESVLSSNNLEQTITLCCQLKAAVVAADPEERLGIREILNLGHTFAHAYESLSQGDIPHGEAVAIGCVQAFKTAHALGQISAEDVAQVRLYFEQHHLPINPPDFSADDIISCMQRDKKVQQSGNLRLVLPWGSIGQVRVQDNVDANLIKTVL
jgi:3-dehydroquinate synthase